MIHIIGKIKEHKLFLAFVFLFAYAHSIQNRIINFGSINWYTFTPEAALFKLISAIVLIIIINQFFKKHKTTEVFRTVVLLKILVSSLFIYLLCVKTFGFFIALVFENVERNFNKETFLRSLFIDFIDGLIFGGFYLGYYYFGENKKQADKIASYNQALSISKINQLKAQLNPHFLFNNLNILDQLIEEDKNIASDFLNEFADIYRYVLQVSDKHLVSINEELAFATKYFNLIKHKYGNAYILETDVKNKTGKIVPLTLQLLFENAFIHNLGTEKRPVIVKLSINNSLNVLNNIVPKNYTKNSNSKALINLKEQYALLSNKNIEISKLNDTFSITIPIIPE